MDNLNLNNQSNQYSNLTGLLPSERQRVSTLDSKFAFSMFGYGVLILATLFYIMKWDTYSLEVVPLKVAYWAGIANTSQLRQLAKICEERRSYGCGIDAMSSLTAISPSTEDFKRLGELYVRAANYNMAIKTYKSALSHYSLVGTNNSFLLRDIHYGLAKSYEAIGQNQFALQNYKNAIDARPNAIQVSVIKAYSRLLKTVGENNLADSLIKKTRKELGVSSSSADLLL